MELQRISNQSNPANGSAHSRHTDDAVGVQKINNRSQAFVKGRAVADMTVANDQRMKNVNAHQAAVQPHLLACLYNKLNTLQAVADCLNTKGLRTARGATFTPTALRRLMLAFNVSF